jgi:glycosyltransferase involved in cell wall biosynthesis
MNIAFDLTQVPVDKTGIGIHAYYLIKELNYIKGLSSKFHFVFFVQDDDTELLELIKKWKSYQVISVKSSIFRIMIFRFFYEQILFPIHCKKLKIDIIYSLHYTTPYFTGIKKVVTFPDMTFYLFPEMHRKIKILYFRSLIPLSLRNSTAILTVSESTKKDLMARFNFLDPEKIKVIHLGVPPPTNKNKENGVSHNLEKYGLEIKKYFLFIGTLEPRKNIVGLLKAFHRLKESSQDKDYLDYKLVIVGKPGWFYKKIFAAVEEMGLQEDVVFTGYITEEEKRYLLEHAYLFIYPSFYEGFGIPVIEAMAHGVPVITSHVSSLPEIAGEAAILINPHDWKEITVAMHRLLSDQQLYKNLSKKSKMQARQFTWEKAAIKTLELFDSIM